MTDFKYSVLLPVYIKDNPEWLKIAIDSMLNQTLPPDEIVIAVDGQIGEELETVISEYEKSQDLFSVYRYKKNEGLGLLLRKTVPLCRNEYIARMDADDYSLPERVEKQFEVLNSNSNINVVGCNVDEFEENIDKISMHVVLPEKPKQIADFAKKRCPIRHPTLLFSKADVIKIGNYSDLKNAQDYELAVRMIQNGLNIYNIQQPLVLMRFNEDFYKRRGGVKYLRTIYRLKSGFLKSEYITFLDFLVSFGGHAIVTLCPVWVRAFFYKKFLRGNRLR